MDFVEKCNNFFKNLETIQHITTGSLSKFADSINVPYSTLQSAMNRRNTTLYTALRIAEGLNAPLNTLTDKLITTMPITQDQIALVSAFLKIFKWFDALSVEDQKTVIYHTGSILEILTK